MEYKAKTGEQLVEKLERFACIASTSSDMMALLDTNFVYLIANKAYLAAFGLTEDKVVGHTIAEVFGEEFFKTVIKPHAKRCLAGAEVKYADWFQYPVSGSQYMAVSYSPYIGENKKVKGFVVNAKNITERKKREEKLESVFNLSPDMIAVCTPEGQFLKINHTWEKVLGYKADEIIRLGWAKLIHPDDVDITSKEVERQQNGASVVNFVNRFRCKDGTYKTFEWQATPAKEGVVYATARDITKRKKAEEALQESEARLKDAQIIAHIGNWEWSLLTNELYWSIENYRIFGLSPKTVPSYKVFEETIHPDDRKFVNKSVDDALSRKKPYNIYFRIVLPHQDERIVQAIGKVDYDREGKPIRFYGTVQDVTERKKMMQELVFQKVSLENKTIALREVIAQIEVEKNLIRENISKNIQEIIMPIFNKLRLKGESKKYVELCKKNLEQISSVFLPKLREIGKNLTPREIEICNMIKGALSSKEIARLLNLSFQTVEKHRNNIRKKLALVREGQNLQSYLQDL